MRLIKDMAISDSLVQYDIFTDRIFRQYSVYHDQYQQKTREISSLLFDSYYLIEYDRETVSAILHANQKLVLIRTNEKQLKEYSNFVYCRKRVPKV